MPAPKKPRPQLPPSQGRDKIITPSQKDMAIFQNEFMRRDIFQKIVADARLQGIVPARTKAAREWFRNKALSSMTSPLTFRTQAPLQRRREGVEPGSMYFYVYDAKWADDLPYYDRFPLVLPVEMYKDGFLGINFHYLPLELRAKLMDALYTISTDRRYNENTRIAASYQTLKAAAKFKYFRPCVKRYLYSHVRSDFFKIEPTEWDMAIFMEWANWKKASAYRVYSDSIKKIRN